MKSLSNKKEVFHYSQFCSMLDNQYLHRNTTCCSCCQLFKISCVPPRPDLLLWRRCEHDVLLRVGVWPKAVSLCSELTLLFRQTLLCSDLLSSVKGRLWEVLSSVSQPRIVDSMSFSAGACISFHICFKNSAPLVFLA